MLLPIGHKLEAGTVVGYTDTAYRVEDGSDVVFVPFVKAHPPVPATPLVRFA